MKKKYIIFGATGAIGKSLANQLYDNKLDCHLVARNEEQLKEIAQKLNCTYSVCDVLKINFVDDLLKDLSDAEILGIAYCIGSIDIKPFKNTRANDFVSSYVLNLVAVTEIIRNFEENFITEGIIPNENIKKKLARIV